MAQLNPRQFSYTFGLDRDERNDREEGNNIKYGHKIEVVYESDGVEL